LFWILGFAAALARVARQRHFLSDVIFGAGFGYACVLLFMKLLGRKYFQFEESGNGESPDGSGEGNYGG